jgi:AraC-like DNA-binding protein
VGLKRRVDRLSVYLQAHIGRSAVEPAVRDMVFVARKGKGASLAQTSARQLQRRFKSEVGVRHKTSRSIFHFRAMFDRLSSGKEGTWAQHAAEAGYFDQPQLARDFKRFPICSAREWMRGQHGLTRALASAPRW